MSLRTRLISSSPVPVSSSPIVILLAKNLVAYGKLYQHLLQQDVEIFLAHGLSIEISMMYWAVIQEASEDVEKNVSGKALDIIPSFEAGSKLFLYQ